MTARRLSPAILIWTALGLGFLALWWWGQALVFRLALLPSVEEGKPGWMVESFTNEFLRRPPWRVAFAPASDRLHLDKHDTSLSAYGIWRASRPGLYRFLVICDDYADLGLDGRSVGSMSPAQQAYNLDEFTVRLEPGPHLIKLDLHNAGEKGYAALLVAEPDQLDHEMVSGRAVAFPDLSNVHNWWLMLGWVRMLWLPGLACLCVAALIILLPRAAGLGWPALATACLVLLAPAALIPPPTLDKAPFSDRGIIEKLQLEQPRYVFIGNSIVESQVDTKRLSELLGGAKVSTVITYGGFTAYDYLMFKNVVLAADIHPKQVFFVFRGTTLTQPTLRTEGEFRKIIESMSHEREDRLDQVLEGRHTWAQRVEAWLGERVFTVSASREQARSWLDQAALFLAIPPLPGNKPQKWRPRLKAAVNARFGLAMLRGAAGDLVEADPAADNGRPDYDFAGNVEYSFLPAIIELAKARSVGLVFMRAQERPGPKGPPPQDPRLTRYMEQVRAYMAERGIPFHDFTGDPELPLSMYASGDHIADPRRYSEILHRRLQGVFR